MTSSRWVIHIHVNSEVILNTTCPTCSTQGVINRRNKDNSVYYYCKVCRTYYTSYNEKNPEEQKPIDEVYMGKAKTLNNIPYDGEIDDKVNMNKAEINGSFALEDIGGTIPTREKMIQWFQVDTKIWKVVKWVPKIWHMGYKDKNHAGKRLPLFGATLYIERIKRIEVEIPAPAIIKFPSLTPYRQSKTSEKSEKQISNIKKAIFASDFHIGYNRDMKTGKLYPFHDRTAFDIMMHVAIQEHIDVLVLGGDMLDLPEMTDKFQRDPSIFFTIRPAMVELKWMLLQIRKKLPHTHLIYMEGNHDKRMRKFTMRQLIAAYDLTDLDSDMHILGIPEMLKLNEIGVDYIDGYPDNEVWLNKNLRCIHGARSNNESGKTALGYARNMNCTSTIFGHIHRCEMISDTVHLPGKTIDRIALSPGMMAYPELVPANRAKHNWQEGFCVIEYEDNTIENPTFTTSIIHIEDAKAIYDGQMIKGSTYVGHLCDDTGWGVFDIPESGE